MDAETHVSLNMVIVALFAAVVTMFVAAQGREAWIFATQYVPARVLVAWIIIAVIM